MISRITQILFGLLIIHSCTSQATSENCSVEIPNNTSIGSGELTGGSSIRYIEAGDTITNFGSGGNMFYIEADAVATQMGGGGHIMYVKNNGTLNISGGGGSNTVYYEPDAIVNNTLQGGGQNSFLECDSMNFILQNVETFEIDIPDSAIQGSDQYSGSGAEVRHVQAGDSVRISGAGNNTYFIESGGVARQTGAGEHVVYIKEGGSITITGRSVNTIYFEPGAIVNTSSTLSTENVIVKCTNITFN